LPPREQLLRDALNARRVAVPGQVQFGQTLRCGYANASAQRRISNERGQARFEVRREIDLPRPRDLEITYTPEFTDIVHDLRGHIGALRKAGATINQ
jgi:hypothetical protein